jgi:hypothetical protein
VSRRVPGRPNLNGPSPIAIRTSDRLSWLYTTMKRLTRDEARRIAASVARLMHERATRCLKSRFGISQSDSLSRCVMSASFAWEPVRLYANPPYELIGFIESVV